MAKKISPIQKELIRVIKGLNKQGKSLDEIDHILVYDMGYSPEFSWSMMKKALGLKLQKVF